MNKIFKGNIRADGKMFFKKTNLVTGEETFYEAHNVCTQAINKCLVYAYCSELFIPGTSGGGVTCVYFRVGDGTAEPSSGDTELGHYMWETNSTDCTLRMNADGTQLISTITFKVPADSAHTGTFSEVGLTITTGLATHALLKDAEDNPFTITKTDVEQLDVTYVVTLTVNGSLDAPALAWASDTAGRILGITRYFRGVGTDVVAASYVSPRHRKIHKKGGRFIVPTEITNTHGITTGANGNQSNCSVVLPLYRLPISHVLNEHFIFSLNLVSAGGRTTSPAVGNIDGRTRYCPREAVNFPDAQVMPIATLRNYSVGVGDGVQTDFVPPIPMWLEDTEVIYVDNIPQVRNVDYTCDSKHNLQKNIELTPLFQSSIVGGRIGTPANYPYITALYVADNSRIKRQGTAAEYLQSRVYSPNSPHAYSMMVMDNENPWIIEMPINDIDIPFEVSSIYLWTYYAKNRQAAQSDDVTIEYSNDGELWTAVLTEVPGAEANHGTSHYPYSYNLDDGWMKYDLQQPITAKFWRVSVHMIGATAYHDRFGMVFLNNGRKLVFNNPPANEAIITMDCQIDVPYKDSNHVMDMTMTYVV